MPSPAGDLSRRKFLRQLVQQRVELLPKQLVRLAEAAALGERRVREVISCDAEGRGDRVADSLEPRELLRRERPPRVLLLHEPRLVTLAYDLWKRDELVLLLER